MSESMGVDRPAADPAATTGAPAQPAPSSAPVQPAAPSLVRRFIIGATATTDLILILPIAALFLLPGLMTLPIDPLREAAVIAEARRLLTGPFIEAWLATKPAGSALGLAPLASAAAFLLAGGASAPDWVARLAPAALLLVSTGLVYAIGRLMAGRWAGIVAALMMVASLLGGAVGRSAGPEALLLTAMLGALLPLARLQRAAHVSPGITMSVLFWVSVAAGLAGGGLWILLPILPAVLAVAASGGARDLRKLGRPIIALPVLVVVIGLYGLLCFETAGASFADWRPGFYGLIPAGGTALALPAGALVLVALVALFPLTAFLIPALTYALSSAGRGAERATGLLAAMALPALVVAELLGDRRPEALLPLVPALALLVGIAHAGGGLAPARGFKTASFGLIALGTTAIAAGLTIWFVLTIGRADVLALAILPVTVLAGFAASASAIRGRPALAILATLVAAGGIAALVWWRLADATVALRQLV